MAMAIATSAKTLTLGLPQFGGVPLTTLPNSNIRLSPSNRIACRRRFCCSPGFLGIGWSSGNCRRLRGLCAPLPPPPPSGSLDLPLLPFQPDEVLVPSECKTLHLYEARFLALLEESLSKREKHFVHFVLDPILTSRSSVGASFAVKHGCLVHIENVERLDIGVLVSIRGIGRVTIVNLVQTKLYLRGVVIPMQDNIPENSSELNSKVSALQESLDDLNSLEIKLKVPKDELFQTHIKTSLTWAEKEASVDCSKAFVPKLAERISFAAFQPVSGSTDSELLALQKQKLRAMDSRDTLDRLAAGLGLAKQNIAMVAAKLAIQSLDM